MPVSHLFIYYYIIVNVHKRNVQYVYIKLKYGIWQSVSLGLYVTSYVSKRPKI